MLARLIGKSWTIPFAGGVLRIEKSSLRKKKTQNLPTLGAWSDYRTRFNSLRCRASRVSCLDQILISAPLIALLNPTSTWMSEIA